MKRLKWWMRIVGGFYLLLFVGTLPAISFPTQSRIGPYPGLAELADTVAFELLVETWFTFGLELAVIGVMLIYASRDPVRNIILSQTVIGLELVRGIVDDLWLIATGHPAGFLIGFIVVHIVIIVPGLIFMRQAKREAALAAAAT